MLGIPWGAPTSWPGFSLRWRTESHCKRLMGADRHRVAPLHLI